MADPSQVDQKKYLALLEEGLSRGDSGLWMMSAQELQQMKQQVDHYFPGGHLSFHPQRSPARWRMILEKRNTSQVTQ